MIESIIQKVIIGIILVSVVLSVYRFIKGPTAADRVVALDTLTTVVTGVLVFLAFIFSRFIYVDISLIFAVLGFIGVLTIARYLEGGL